VTIEKLKLPARAHISHHDYVRSLWTLKNICYIVRHETGEKSLIFSINHIENNCFLRLPSDRGHHSLFYWLKSSKPITINCSYIAFFSYLFIFIFERQIYLSIYMNIIQQAMWFLFVLKLSYRNTYDYLVLSFILVIWRLISFVKDFIPLSMLHSCT